MEANLKKLDHDDAKEVCEHVEGDETRREDQGSIGSPVEASHGLRQSLSSGVDYGKVTPSVALGRKVL